ncbi:hypothetical protein BDV29DRAFT_164481 [Aspergillus leporis]|uniref:Zn(2)-C6 fungal-type domain-containing protein n=1 Tax=Aspergillus leporis TaxID=41062 RepID=A0A5N5XFF2_9EURO|nr:hypothetical protein BDV29DRAFT_164481 [Aspergillus leporis]
MSNISRFTGKFRARIEPSALHETLAAKVTKRQRASLVCDQCRKSKLRCDKGQPCSSCVKRHELMLAPIDELRSQRLITVARPLLKAGWRTWSRCLRL